MSDALDLLSTTAPPSPEATTAGALFAIAEKLALSDELGSTHMATEISKRANIIAKLEIRNRTPEYTTAKDAVDAASAEFIRTLQRINQARELVVEARAIATKVDGLIGVADGLIP